MQSVNPLLFVLGIALELVNRHAPLAFLVKKCLNHEELILFGYLKSRFGLFQTCLDNKLHGQGCLNLGLKVYIYGSRVGVDSLREQKKLKARKMLENGDESHLSSARFVSLRAFLHTTFLSSSASFESKSAKRSIAVS